MNVLVL